MLIRNRNGLPFNCRLQFFCCTEMISIKCTQPWIDIVRHYILCIVKCFRFVDMGGNGSVYFRKAAVAVSVWGFWPARPQDTVPANIKDIINIISFFVCEFSFFYSAA